MKNITLATVLLFASITFFSCSKDSPKPLPVVSFTYSGAGIAPANVIFINNTTNATSYVWNFGDGTTSININPSHSYAANGTYAVTLRAVNGNGSTTKVDTVSIGATSLAIDTLKITNLPSSVYGKNVYAHLVCSNGATLQWTTLNNISANTIALIFTLSTPEVITNFSATNQVLLYQQLGTSQSPSTDALLFDGNLSFAVLAAQGMTNNSYPPVINYASSGGYYNQVFDITWH